MSSSPITRTIRLIVGQRELRLVARLLRRLDQRDVNPLAARIDERFKRQDVPPLYGHKFNSGKWGMSGHISLDRTAVLFVTLEKSTDMTFGAAYVDRFEDAGTFIWSSQDQHNPREQERVERFLMPWRQERRSTSGSGAERTDVAFVIPRVGRAAHAQRLATYVRHLPSLHAGKPRDLETASRVTVLRA